ncbi:MAG TPA: hypothetical protein VGG48_09040 [Rhizomicrobium sp.]
MSQRPLQFGLFAVCLLMAGLFVYELSAAPADFPLPDVHLKPRAVAIAEAQPFVPPPASAFDAVNDRTLFLPSRKSLTAPATTGAAAINGPPPPADITLVGVLMDGQNSVAEVKTAGAVLSQPLRVGDAVGTWSVSAIGPDHVTLKSGTFTQDVHMDAKTGAPLAPGSPGAAPPPGQPPGTLQ